MCVLFVLVLFVQCVCRFLWLAVEMSVSFLPSGISYEERLCSSKETFFFLWSFSVWLLAFQLRSRRLSRCFLYFVLLPSVYELKSGFMVQSCFEEKTSKIEKQTWKIMSGLKENIKNCWNIGFKNKEKTMRKTE